MFRPIRRKEKEMPLQKAQALLQKGRRGVLAVNGDDGYPYAVLINYFYNCEAQKIYFHSARAGHKFDALCACDRVCFTVYGNETRRENDWAGCGGAASAACAQILPQRAGGGRGDRALRKRCADLRDHHRASERQGDPRALSFFLAEFYTQNSTRPAFPLREGRPCAYTNE